MFSFRLSTEPIIFLYNIVLLINYITVPQLLLKKLCLREHVYNETLCRDERTVSQDIHQEASKWWFYLLLAFQIPAIFTVLICGPITDIIGRRKGLIYFASVDVLASICFLLNAYFLNAHPAFLIPGYLVSSLFGELQGVICICYAFVADITRSNSDCRTSRMGLLEASIYFSGVFAGLSSGYLLKEFGFVSVFLISILIDCVILLYISTCLPTLEQQHQLPAGERVQLLEKTSPEEEEGGSESQIEESANDDNSDYIAGSNLSFIRAYLHQVKSIIAIMRRQPVVVLMILTFMLLYFGVLGEKLVQTLYLKNRPFSFSFENIGYFVAVQGASRALGTILICQLSFYCLHCDDYMLMVIGTLSEVFSFIFIGVSRTKINVFLATACSFALPVGMTAIRSVLTKNVPGDKYGTVLAILASLNIISGLITNIISLWLYRLTISIFTGIVYFGLAAFAATAMVIIITTYVMIERPKSGNGSLTD